MSTLVEVVNTKGEEITGVRLDTGAGNRVFIADSLDWYTFYTNGLLTFLDSNDIVIVNNIADAMQRLKVEGYFAAYVLDPYLAEQSDGQKSELGLDLAMKIARVESNYQAIWLLSERHDLLDEARKLGFTRLYTKLNDEQNKYGSTRQFLEDIKQELNSGRRSLLG